MTNGIGAWEINQDLFCKNKLDFAPTLSLHALTALCQKTGGRFSPPDNHNTHEKTLCNSCPVFGLPCLSQSISAAFEKRVVDPLFSTGMRPIVV